MHIYTIASSCIYILRICIHPQKISGTSGKNHFYKMNGDVGMAGL